MKPDRQAAGESCPCGSGALYVQCCGILHTSFAQTGQLDAATPEALMRSRYSAYVRRLEPYLLATWHSSTRPATLELAADNSRWIGLEIRANSRKNGASAATATAGTVEFIARYKVGGRAHRLHESSRFVQEGGIWYYVDGDLHD